MSWNNRIRQLHRWVSMIFTAVVAALFAASALGEIEEWVYLLPLPPLALLLATGLYLFALPYVARRRGGQRPAA